MPEIIYSEQTKTVSPSPESKADIISRKLSVFGDDTKVCVVGSSLIGGKAKSGKQWQRWHTHSSTGFRKSPHGLVVPYSARRESLRIKRSPGWMNGSPGMTFDILTGQKRFGDQVDALFTYYSSLYLGVDGLYSVYPMAERCGIRRYRDIPPGLHYALRAEDLEGLASRLFGKTRVTDNLVERLTRSHPIAMVVASQFRGFVDQKSLERMLGPRRVVKKNGISDVYDRPINLRPILKEMEKGAVNKLAKRQINDALLSTLLLASQGSTSAQRLLQGT